MMPNVIASVIGMLSAISSAERHSQKPISATRTTRHDRFVQAGHEQVDVLRHLLRLVADALDHQVFGQERARLGDLVLDRLAEVGDLQARSSWSRPA